MACLVLLRCLVCGREQYRRRIFVPVAKPLYKGHEEPLPEMCDLTTPGASYIECVGLLELVPGGMIDLLPSNFEIDMEMFGDGSDKRKLRVHSLKELRTIENESLKRHANGEGQPLIFRDLSQDKGNARTHVLKNTSYETSRSLPVPKRQTTSGLPISGSALESVPD